MSKNTIEGIVGKKCRLTTATSHAFVDGDKIEISGIYRMYKWRFITKLVYFFRYVLPESWVYEPPKEYRVFSVQSVSETEIDSL